MKISLIRFTAGLLLLTLIGAFAVGTAAQDLEPRAYSRSPVGTNFGVVAYGYQSGDVLVDSSLPLRDVSVQLNSFSFGYGHTLGLAGRQSNVTIAVPYVFGTAKGTVFEEQLSARRSGLADVRLRFSMNLLGSPAVTPRDFARRKANTLLGASLTVIAPTGQYDPNRLVNLGSNRWSFKPEVGLAKPFGAWTLELDGGVWLFTENKKFFGGVQRRQEPLGSFQGHLIYTRPNGMWIALDGTYYTGGRTIVNGVINQDRQRNSRLGTTFSFPISQSHSLKLVFFKGVTTRIGGDITGVAIAWQFLWFNK